MPVERRGYAEVQELVRVMEQIEDLLHGRASLDCLSVLGNVLVAVLEGMGEGAEQGMEDFLFLVKLAREREARVVAEAGASESEPQLPKEKLN